MAKLTLVQGGVEHKVLQYAMPVKGREIYLKVNGFDVTGRVTAARGRTYTYFPYAGGEFYVAGELSAAPCQMHVPEGFEPKTHTGRAAQYEALKAKRAEARAATGEAPKKRGKKAKAASEAAAAA